MTASKRPTTPCPSDETLGALVEGALGGGERDRVEAHVADCPACLDVVAASLPEETSPQVATPAASSAATSARRSRAGARRWALAAAVLLVAGAMTLFPTLRRPVVARLGPALARLTGRWLGTALRADSVLVGLGPSRASVVVKLGAVHVGGDHGLSFSADEIGVTLALAAPLFGEPVVRGVQLTGPTVELAARTPATLVWPRSDRARVFDVLAQSGRVDVVDARLVVRTPGSPFVVDHLTGGLERVADGARLALQGRAGNAGVDVVGTIAEADQAFRLTVAGRDLDVAMLPLLARQMTGTADLRLDFTGTGDTVRVDGRIAVRNGKWLGRGPTRLLPLDRETRALLAAAGDLGGADLSFEEARAVFAWRAGGWRLPRIFVTDGAAIVGGRARVGADGTLTGHGTARVPAAIVATLEPHDPVLASYRDASGSATVPFTVSGSTDVPHFGLDRP